MSSFSPWMYPRGSSLMMDVRSVSDMGINRVRDRTPNLLNINIIPGQISSHTGFLMRDLLLIRGLKSLRPDSNSFKHRHHSGKDLLTHAF